MASAAVMHRHLLTLGLVLLVGRLAVAARALAKHRSIEFLRGTPTLLLICVFCFWWRSIEHLLDVDLAHRPGTAGSGGRGLSCRCALAVPPRPNRRWAKPGVDQLRFFVVFPRPADYIVPALVAQLVIVSRTPPSATLLPTANSCETPGTRRQLPVAVPGAGAGCWRCAT